MEHEKSDHTEVRLKFKVNLGRDKRESRRPFPGIRDNELNSSTIPPKTGRVVSLTLKDGEPFSAREGNQTVHYAVTQIPLLSLHSCRDFQTRKLACNAI